MSHIYEQTPKSFEMVSMVLEELLKQTLPYINHGKVTKFHASAIPPISISDYIRRLMAYSQCSDACCIMALIYIDRLVDRHPSTILTLRNMHRVFFTSLLMAIKFHDDKYYENSFYAKIGGVTVQEVSRMEAEILLLLDWNLNIREEAFEQYSEQLRAHCTQIAIATKTGVEIPEGEGEECESDSTLDEEVSMEDF